MIKQTPNDCMGAQPTWRKLGIALGIISNPFTLLLDKVGLAKHPVYKIRGGGQIETRGGTTDINDVVVVVSGNEYPPELLGIEGVSNPVVLDCGGHIGSFSIFAKKINPQSQIWIMEPVGGNRDLLAKNIAANNLQNITVIPFALYGQNGTFYIDLSGKQFDALNISSEKPAHEDFLQVEALTLPEVINRYQVPRIDLLKMDVEGSEYNIFERSMPTFSSSVRRVIMEFHPAGDTAKRNQLVGMLSQGGFELIYETKNILGFKNKAF